MFIEDSRPIGKGKKLEISEYPDGEEYKLKEGGG